MRSSLVHAVMFPFSFVPTCSHVKGLVGQGGLGDSSCRDLRQEKKQTGGLTDDSKYEHSKVAPTP